MKFYWGVNDLRNDCRSDKATNTSQTVCNSHHTSGVIWSHVNMIYLFIYKISFEISKIKNWKLLKIPNKRLHWIPLPTSTVLESTKVKIVIILSHFLIVLYQSNCRYTIAAGVTSTNKATSRKRQS